MKVNNKEIVIRKNGEQVCKLHNRITNNGLDWFMFKNLDQSTATPLYPQFLHDSAVTSGDTIRAVQLGGFNVIYCKFDSADVLTDLSYDMIYDIKGFENKTRVLTELDNGMERVKRYDLTVETAQVGQVLQTIGFGGWDIYSTHYLYSYIQVGFLGLTFAENDIITIERKDIGTTELTIDTNTYAAKENILELWGHLKNITFENDVPLLSKTYSVLDLVFSTLNSGELTITGFDTFIYADGDLYPALDLYPSDTLYPERAGKYLNMIMNFQFWAGISEFDLSTLLNKATISNDGGVITVNYAYERGI